MMMKDIYLYNNCYFFLFKLKSLSTNQLSTNILGTNSECATSISPYNGVQKHALSLKTAQHYNIVSQAQSYVDSSTQNEDYDTQMSCFLSQSTSHPSLTFKLEKLLPLNTWSSYPSTNNSNSCQTTSATVNSCDPITSQNTFNNFEPSGHVNQIQVDSTPSNSKSFNSYAATGHHTVHTVNNKAKKLRRQPSLSFKTPKTEYHEKNEDSFLDFKFTDCFNSSNTANNNYTNSFSSTGDMNSYNLNLTYTYLDNSVNSSLNDLTSNYTNTNMSSLATTTSLDNDDLCLDIDALSDFVSKSGSCSRLFDDLPDLEDLMSLVTFEASSYESSAFQYVGDANSMPNFYDLDMDSLMTMDLNPVSNGPNNGAQRTTRSAPPSPTPQRKKQRPTGNLPWNKNWYFICGVAYDEKNEFLF